MAVVFPSSPLNGQTVTDPVTNATWMWQGPPNSRWIPAASGAVFLTDAPSDGRPYARQDGAWEPVAGDPPPFHSGPTAPTPPNNEGDLWYDTDNQVLMVYQGGSWVPSIQPVSGFLPLNGGTLTGSLTVAANPSVTSLGYNYAYGYYVPNTPYPDFAIRYDAPRKNIIFALGWSYYWDVNTFNHGWMGNGTAIGEIRQGDGWFWANYLGTFGGQSAFVNVSDARFKEDIQPDTHGLETILKLEPKAFERGAQPRGRRRRELGFLANDVEAVLPEAVVNLGAFPKGDDKIENTLGVAETAIIPVLVNAIKQLTARLEALEARR